MHVFVGWDPREKLAADVCKYTILKHSRSSKVHMLRQSTLREQGYFNREFFMDGNQYVDKIDKKPFSTQFSFTRFLTPIIARDLGLRGWVAFCDLDFVFTTDIDDILSEVDDKYAVMCVKHDFQPEPQLKMDDMKQEPYPRKNWSSFMLFNLEHPANNSLTKEMVNTMKGSELHRFCWLQDDEIGALNPDWNTLALKNEGHDRMPPKGAVHYTWGMPFMKGYEYCEYSDYFFNVFGRMNLATA